MTDEQKAKQRFFALDKEITTFIPQCAVCKSVDGINCKALKEKAYGVEIAIAKQLDNEKAIERIKENLEKERRRIYGE